MLGNRRSLKLPVTIASLLFVLLTLISLLTPTSAEPNQSVTTIAAAQLQLFESESSAQKHCPNDTVVWLNTATGIWHEKGMRWYGRTRQGAYVCRSEAMADGDRDTRNGQ